MKWEVRTELVVALFILVAGGIFLAFEYFAVKFYPVHKRQVAEETLKMLPYRNEGIGVELQVAAGLYGRVESFPGGVKISRPKFWSIGPSLVITSQPNPDQAKEFSLQALASWQTDGVTHEIPRYNFEHTSINGRDAALIWQYKGRAMMMTTRIISPDRIIEANCSVGAADEDLYLQACDDTVHTIKILGSEPVLQPASGAEAEP